VSDPLRVLVAPDAFKGSATNIAVARAMALGVVDAWPGAKVTQCPLADGGEGTLAAVAAAAPGGETTVPVVGPHGEALNAAYWASAEGTAVIESARAIGLPQTRRRDPLSATSIGAGALCAAALTAGHRTLRLACGGSATVDGGVGALNALGFRFLDGEGRPLPPGGGALLHLAEIVPPPTVPAGVEIWCDVKNPLLGPEGAATVYGPQKGADAAAVAQLEAGLARLARVLTDTFGRDPSAVVGAGAAGGLAGGVWAALGAPLRSGFDVIADMVGLDAHLSAVDLVLTGEGRLDAQTAHGKTVAGVLERARRVGVPVWAFAGGVAQSVVAEAPDGVVFVPIVEGPMTLADAMVAAPSLIRRAVARSFALARTSTSW
jgi:glycerate kinase